jgi:hypothetical protein
MVFAPFRMLTFRATLRARAGATLVAVAALLALGCAGRAELIRGELTTNDLDALVDSDPARRLLTDLLARRPLDPHLEATALSLLPADVVWAAGTNAVTDLHRPPDQARLRELSEEISIDFAALAFARAVGADKLSRTVQASFDQFLHDGLTRSEKALRRPGAFPYTVLFAPSWLYRSHPETGADFARQRQLLDRVGVANRLIATGESASIEDNAAAIAGVVRAARPEEGGLILVSASKSGAEAALALSRLLAPEEAARVVAWVNIVGALRGTPLADSALRPPFSWLVRCVFWLNGWDWAGLTSMATKPSHDRLDGARLPESIAVVNVVAVPLSGSVGATVWWGYRVLRSHGPNDGVVLLADTVWPGGANVVAIGPDHLFTPREDDAQSLALLRAVHVAVQAHDVTPEPVVAVGSRRIGRDPAPPRRWSPRRPILLLP